MEPYDIERAFEEIEDELIESMIRNMKRHRVEEISEGKEWTMWQAEQLKALGCYKKQNKKKFGKRFGKINNSIENIIKNARKQGSMDQEIEILEAIKNGFKGAKRSKKAVMGEFFKLNSRKLDALIKATQKDFQRGEHAILRMAEDQYRQIIFNAQVYANTGAGTYEQAVDMATKDFLSRGINCIEYKNGARHTMKDYADMAIRTAAKRAYLAGEGEKRVEWGISTVIMNKRGNPCPKCLPFCGKVLIDDVWSGGNENGVDPETKKKYPTMSYAISKGLYHPRCKDSHTTYFPGISTADDAWTKKELKDIGLQAKQEAKQQHAERQAEKFERLAKYSLDEENQKLYTAKKDAWKEMTEQNRKEQLENLEKQFADMTEGYSYDDFVRDFGSVEEGFEGAEEGEIERAKEIADKIKELKSNIKPEGTIRTKVESIQALKAIGIDFKENSVGGISRETANKYADFITNFEQSHAGYFVKNESQLKSIVVVDRIRGQQDYATGIYKSETKTIEIKASGIKSKQSTMLSRSDDFELHSLAHEYGHYVADSLEKNIGATEGDIVQRSINKYFDGDIFKSTKDLKDCLSAYGSTNYGEAFAEAFAEAYTCNEPGEFAKIFKEELENTLNTGVVKSKDSGIIEMYRKADSRSELKFISDKVFNNLTISVRKKGAVIIRGTKEAEEHLEKLGAAAANVGDVLIFRKDVCVSEVLEETYHFQQNLEKMNGDKEEPLRSILNEIDAKQYLLENSDKYKIPRNEVELTKKQLESYKKQLEEYREGGRWYGA